MDQAHFELVWGAGHSFDRLIIPETVALIERWEQYRESRYPDGKWPNGSIRYSIGFGHSEGGDTEPLAITNDMYVTLAQAREILRKDIEFKAKFINARIKAPLTTFQFGALVSLTYQYGQGRVDADGTLFPLLARFDYIKAGVAMLKLNKKKDGTELDGLTLRRASEIGFYMTRKG